MKPPLRIRFRLATKLIVLPVFFLVLIFAVCWAVLSSVVDRAMLNTEQTRLEGITRTLQDGYNKELRNMRVMMKLTVVQQALYDGFFGALADDYEFLRGFLARTGELAGVDDVVVVSDDGTILQRAVSDKRGEKFRYQDVIRDVLAKETVTDRGRGLDRTINHYVKVSDDGIVLFTSGPVLDVESVVGAIVFVKRMDMGFLKELKSGLGEDVELSLATSEGVVVSTIPGFKVASVEKGSTLTTETGKRSFFTRFIPLSESGVYIGISHDRTKYLMAQSRIRNLMVVIFLSALVLLVMITLVNIKRILKAIRELNENAGAISKGDLRGTLTVRGDDEIAEMSVIFGGMADSLRHMVKKLITISSEIAVTNSKIWSALSSNIQNIERQTDEASQISTATTELSQTASEIAQNTSHAAEISKAVTGEAKKGMEKMKSADRMINDVASAAGVLNAMISELNSGIGSIGQVVELITDIADQTNLLALNAAIEAARAGEHGRGFAVVADEVRKLAEKTMKATSDIADTIRSIQEKSSDTSHQMGVATGKITESVGIINETAELLEKIVSYATLSEEETEKIATAVEEQSNTIEEISQSIGHSAGISREILETFRGFFEKTDRLSQAVELLEEEVRRFKLPPDRTLEIEAARVAHKNWVQRLYRMYYMKEHISVDEIKDHRECRFGKWYYSTDGQECSGLKGFHQIENPHRLLHERAKEAVEAFEKGERRRCLELIEEVDRISEEIILYLDGMLSDIQGGNRKGRGDVNKPPLQKVS